MTVMALFVLASVFIVGAIYWQTSNILTQRNVASIIDETRALSEIAARNGVPVLLHTIQERDRAGGAMLYGLAGAGGETIWLGGLRHWPEPLQRDNATAVFEFHGARRPHPGRSNVESPPANASGQTPASSHSPSSGHTTAQSLPAAGAAALAIGATLRLPDGERLLVARDVTEQQHLANVIRQWFLAGLALLSVLAIATGWAINRVLMQRLDAMTQTANSIMAGDLSNRIPVTQNRDEFDAIAENLNAMLDRIESLMQGLREVSDNIAHDLKTPLSRLRMRAEEALRSPRGDAACREGLEATLTEADELIRTFNALLRVARLEAGTLGGNLETFNVAALIEDLAEFYEPVVEEAGATVTIETNGALLLSADRQLISQALTNLIENALKYGISSGDKRTSRISIGAARSPTGIELWVADHGPGIARQDYDRVLKRFVRLDAARTKPGTGLGLSLVAAVVRQHGGTISLADNAPGLKVVLHLPPERFAGVVLGSNSDKAANSRTLPHRTQQTAVET